MLRLTVTN